MIILFKNNKPKSTTKITIPALTFKSLSAPDSCLHDDVRLKEDSGLFLTRDLEQDF